MTKKLEGKTAVGLVAINAPAESDQSLVKSRLHRTNPAVEAG